MIKNRRRKALLQPFVSYDFIKGFFCFFTEKFRGRLPSNQVVCQSFPI